MAPEPNPPADLALVGVTVLDGRGGPPAGEQTVVVRAGRIDTVAPSEAVTLPEGMRAWPGRGLTVLPGIIDTHVHLGFYPPAEVLGGGVTTVRDLGWPPDRLAALQRQAGMPGATCPRLVWAGQILTAPGGYPTRAAWAPAGTARPVAGEEDAHQAVADLARAGAAVIKVALDEPAGPTLPEATLAAVVRAARERGLAVTAHVAGTGEVAKALAAGVAELAHWPLKDTEVPGSLIGELASTVTVVPTLHVEPTAVRRQGVRRFLAMGGQVVYGTDLGNQGPPPGVDLTELRLLVDAGLSPGEALAAATSRAARQVGLDDTGRVAPGARADLLVVEGDPLADLSVLGSIRLVLRDGWATGAG